ncbi:YgjP-like metallopeptidase domain-containing protein [Sulfurimonas sp. HSL-1656]|uniref:YgjP-like metallopeptidase domain-containing protein n=1 Tax=Thiomicrolovo subterrani TaxID=3131934 RepID=UPI0031F735E7
MKELRYLAHYPETLQAQVRRLIESGKLGDFLLQKYPEAHTLSTDGALYDYADAMRSAHMRNSQPLHKVVYDTKISVVDDALGMHTRISKVHGGRVRSRREIRIASLFKRVPEPFLQMIVAHELAHLKERDHNKAFYNLCEHMAPGYHQLEFDLRLYLTHLEHAGKLY